MSARSSRGRSSRRPQRSASTASRASPSSTSSPPASPCRSSTRSSSGATPGSAWRSWAPRLAVAGIYASGKPEQMAEWIPQCFGTADDPKIAAFCSSEPDAGSDVSGDADHRQVRRGEGRVGPERPEGLGHQRRHRQRPRRDRLGRPRARRPRPRRLHHPARDQGPRDGREGQEARHPRLAYRRRPPRRLPHPRQLPARRQGEARRAPCQGPRGRAVQGAGGDEDLRGLAADGRRDGDRHRPRRLRVLTRTTRRSASSSAGRSSTTRRSPSRSPT